MRYNKFKYYESSTFSNTPAAIAPSLTTYAHTTHAFPFTKLTANNLHNDFAAAAKMSLGVQARLNKYPKKNELLKSHSQAQILANKLKQDGIMNTVENIMQAVDQVAALLASPAIDPTISYKDSIINLCQHLKVYGAYLDILYQDQLNRAFVVFRNSSQDEQRLDYLSRLHLLELIELRAKDWKGSDLMDQYYRKKVENNDIVKDPISIAQSVSPPMLLSPGELIKPSGKFKQPTRIAGKNYCKDEVVIRNADSGKVMGIKGRRVHMIEELSETIISFQRVNPGAKERLVQITGANEESIVHAKQLIEDTIRRNASPVREGPIANSGGGGPLTGSSSSINSSASEESAQLQQHRRSRALIHSLSTNDASTGEYKYTVIVGGQTIRITGANLDLVRTSKLVLDEYFSGEPIHDMGQFYSFDSLPQSQQAIDTDGGGLHNIGGGSSGTELQAPLSPESLPSPSSGMANGKLQQQQQLAMIGESEMAPEGKTTALRRPRVSIEDLMRGTDPSTNNGKCQQYSIEDLARLAMSPMCLLPPNDWERINKEYPIIVKQIVEFFNAKQYLQERSSDNMKTVLSADADLGGDLSDA